ncbi:UDP-N-acetylglucosamine 1-carboxyvinyltransferase [Caldicellulosiruptor changbaiensis]|uniref:UDP-N-acetylglucosamine 1-carboxyvinyltransferase n=1 Tax=Caldicellulosiruptor changbaiensis TaxID=1222016 RepID=A0A3T0D396_9FIRM|nr:UDP-N-acetylglucosamine 1-carboxyvinyltransferase [Caldicellulosiruptor changbaiensis]AZT89695.1 UDP-N-acetylglucosamine 1-carboxyvinyltransferase [Caldicellulosiruptor changbaiensis]
MKPDHEKLIIEGGNPLFGEVQINGAKNAAVAVIPAALMAEGESIIENLPLIEDVFAMDDILLRLGAKIEYDNHSLKIDASNLQSYIAPYESVRKIRASYYLIGALLTRFGKAEVAMPGGCNFGARPIDQHIKGFRALGADVKIENGMIKAYAEELVGTKIYLDVVSVGATINLMLAAVKAKGTTIIENAAKEPHVVDVANFLNAMGAKIKGAGTDVIRIEGVKELHPTRYAIIPDQIEAGTYMIAACATKGHIRVKNIIPKHLESLTAKLLEMGAEVNVYEDSIEVRCKERLRASSIKTMPYPGFPTDLQPQMTVLLSLCSGTSVVTEGVWENRYQYVDELKKMGANIKVEGRVAIVEGVESLQGAEVSAVDLRAGAALIVAGLAAKGRTVIYNTKNVDRGYENIDYKLKLLGARVSRV